MIEPTQNTVQIYQDRAIKIIEGLRATAAKAEDRRFAARTEAHDLAIKVIELEAQLAARDLRIAELEARLTDAGRRVIELEAPQEEPTP